MAEYPELWFWYPDLGGGDMPDRLSVSLFDTGKRIALSRAGSEVSLRGKSVQFLLALLATESPRYVFRDELHRLSAWRTMSAASVGKQAARIVDSLNRGLGPIIEWELKTQAWRLKERELGHLPQSVKDEARQLLSHSNWSGILRFADVPAASMASWMKACGSALVEMTLGQAENGYRKLRLANEISDHEGIGAISDVLATRIGQALPRPHLPVPGLSSSSAFLEAAEARRVAAYARTAPSDEWPDQFDLLYRKLLRMIDLGDTSSQAILFNSLAILARRLGRIGEAIDCIREAAALALFSGDIVLIQNVSFNFGNILSDAARSDPECCSRDTYLGLIELDMEIRRRLQIGKDSAQAELLYAFLTLEKGELASVERGLAEAKEIISVSQQPYDIALFQRIKGLLLCDSNPAGSSQHAEGIAALEQAEALYESVGNKVAAAEVARDLLPRRSFADANAGP